MWTDSTNGVGSPTADDIMAVVTRSFSPSQLSSVFKVPTPQDVVISCPTNFLGVSDCFSAVVFNYLPTSPQDRKPVNYTIRGCTGISYVDVWDNAGDYEKRILPLQWAIDSVSLKFIASIFAMLTLGTQAIIELQTKEIVPTPQEWPFTQESNAEENLHMRISMSPHIFIGIAPILMGRCFS